MFNYYQWKRAAIASERLADGLPPAPPSRGVTRDGLVPWVPPSATRTGVAPLFPEPLPEPDEETLEHRHTLAASAQARYDMWAATTLGWDDDEDKKAKEAHPSQHTFRDRVPAKELHGRMSFARHASHAARIAEAEAANRRYLKRPQYQDPGLNTIGMTFSFHRQGYHMRQRMKSMEVGGPMRFQAQTESERIMEENVKASARDVFSATVPSEHEHPRAAVAAQREGARARWVGPRDFDSTSMHPRKQLSPPSALLGAGEPYRDTLDQDCYGNLNYGHTRVRDPALEVGGMFMSSVPSNQYIPNPSRTCTWNVKPELPVLPPKTYHRLSSKVPDAAGGSTGALGGRSSGTAIKLVTSENGSD